jgi:hypothetical protein
MPERPWWPLGFVWPAKPALSFTQRISSALSPSLCFFFSIFMAGVASVAYFLYSHTHAATAQLANASWDLSGGEPTDAGQSNSALPTVLHFTRLMPSKMRLSVEDFWRAERVAKRRTLQRESRSQRSQSRESAVNDSTQENIASVSSDPETNYNSNAGL